GKCLNRRASETSDESASSRVVVPWKPFSAKTRRTALMMAARRSSLDSFMGDFIRGLAPCRLLVSIHSPISKSKQDSRNGPLSLFWCPRSAWAPASATLGVAAWAPPDAERPDVGAHAERGHQMRKIQGMGHSHLPKFR